MADLSVFVSVGGTANNQQEEFVRAVEDRLRSENLVPHTVGRNTFSADAPIRAVENTMDKCSGAVVIALERSYFREGWEKRGGPNEKNVADVKLPTPWNHIEAAMSYTRGLPLLVIVEDGLKPEGLLEHGYDWYVQSMKLNTASLNSLEFNGVLANWKSKVLAAGSGNGKRLTSPKTPKPEDLTIGQIIGSMKPGQLWALLSTFAVIVAGAFALGAKFVGQ